MCVLAGNFKPIKCEIKKVEGGYYIRRSSVAVCFGDPHAHWCYFGFPVDDGNGGMEMAIMVVPGGYEIFDDWHVMGLKGQAVTV